MERFTFLVGEQLKTMDQLLFLQSEIERCQDIQRELEEMEQEAELESLLNEIKRKKEELRQIQQQFEYQTEAVIESYQNDKELKMSHQ
ncbi:YgaB family protein [Bacillus coahuilensis]|uniref:YgaB family protein n=1 Tax=Bacillus coahuilensis TaxID=408580 RepID=UPI0001850B3F|nr:YgaB family protein [Bacillus coahuilensis]